MLRDAGAADIGVTDEIGRQHDQRWAGSVEIGQASRSLAANPISEPDLPVESMANRRRPVSELVGEAGFEPTISYSQSTRVARLRYFPP